MNIEELKDTLPEYAKDIRLNLSNLFGNISQSGLSEAQFFGVALAVGYSLKHVDLLAAIKESIAKPLLEVIDVPAKTAATLMAMNNIYYRFVHLSEDAEFKTMPANLRMAGLRAHGIPQVDFELYALSVSAINGCGMCISTHVEELLKEGMTRVSIQSAIRLAATLHATEQALFIGP